MLIARLTPRSKRTHARTAIRKFITDHLKTRVGRDAVFVAVVPPSERHGRFYVADGAAPQSKTRRHVAATGIAALETGDYAMTRSPFASTTVTTPAPLRTDTVTVYAVFGVRPVTFLAPQFALVCHTASVPKVPSA